MSAPNVVCDCGHIACVCAAKRRHETTCKFRRAVACAVGIECEHGFDVCPMCDPCTCGVGVATEDFSVVSFSPVGR